MNLSQIPTDPHRFERKTMNLLQIPAHPALLLSCVHNETITLTDLEELLIRTINPCMFRNLQSRLAEETEDLDPDECLRHRVTAILRLFNAAVEMNVGQGSLTEFLRTPYDMEIGTRSVVLCDCDDDGSSYEFVSYTLPKDLRPLGDPLYPWTESDAKHMEDFMHARGWYVQGVASRNPLAFVREH